MTRDKIILHGCVFHPSLGVPAEERAQRQPIILDVELSFDIRPAAESENLSDTIDYQAVHILLKNHLEGKEFVLVETMIESTAELLLKNFPAERVFLRLKKPQALVLGAPEAWPGIEITRTR
jgi:dihydroneopterin aldolase